MTRSASRPHFLPLVVSVALAACAGATPSGGTTAPSAAASASTAPASASASASASAPTSPPVAPTSAPSISPAGFACGYPMTVGSTRSQIAAVTDVSVRTGADADSITYTFDGTGTPELTLARVSPPFVKDPSELPLTAAGSSFVSIRMIQTSGGGYANASGTPTYSGPNAFTPNGTRLRALVQQGDFEAVFSWIAGLTGPMCYRVTALSTPARLVIDVRAP